jgi:opacity protein-like surface antigen
MFKKIMTVSVLGVSALGMVAANAATDGIYVLGQAGYANSHIQDKIGSKIIETYPLSGDGIFSADNNNLGGRLAVGYQFNPYLAVEMGYMRLLNQKGTFKRNLYKTITETSRQNAFDVAAKGILPISDKFNVYGKVGIAYLTSTVDSNRKNLFFDISEHKFAPEVGLGFTYNITNNMFVDTSLTHIQSVGKNKPGNIDFTAVGIGYSFG